MPIRYGRMLRSPFTFLRGSAPLMAYDLATTPTTGIRVQACGDCHLMNFGLFATPERHLVFDVNDFDETHAAPWEWDLKRLVVSFAIAARDNQLSDAQAQAAVMECTRAYREHLRACSHRSPYDNQGERVVMGQRLMQSSSDIFLGWARGRQGYDFYVRQLRDMKMSYPIEGMTAVQLTRYAEMCGRTLGCAHAKSGDAATISRAKRRSARSILLAAYVIGALRHHTGCPHCSQRRANQTSSGS